MPPLVNIYCLGEPCYHLHWDTYNECKLFHILQHKTKPNHFVADANWNYKNHYTIWSIWKMGIAVKLNCLCPKKFQSKKASWWKTRTDLFSLDLEWSKTKKQSYILPLLSDSIGGDPFCDMKVQGEYNLRQHNTTTRKPFDQKSGEVQAELNHNLQPSNIQTVPSEVEKRLNGKEQKVSIFYHPPYHSKLTGGFTEGPIGEEKGKKKKGSYSQHSSTCAGLSWAI